MMTSDMNYGKRLAKIIPQSLQYIYIVLPFTVRAPGGKLLCLLPVGCLITVADEANHRCIVHKRDDGVGSMCKSAVVGEEGAEGRARTRPCGTPVLSVMVVEQVCPDLTCRGLLVGKSIIQ